MCGVKTFWAEAPQLSSAWGQDMIGFLGGRLGQTHLSHDSLKWKVLYECETQILGEGLSNITMYDVVYLNFTEFRDWFSKEIFKTLRSEARM